MKKVRLVCCFCLLLVGLLAMSFPGIALAQDEGQPVIADNITLTPTYPTVESIAGGNFEFEMELAYIGAQNRVFDLRATAPAGWDVYMTPQYEKDNKISSISLKPSFGAGETILVEATAPFWPLPDPGDYKITFEATSDKIKSSTQLTARITAKYLLDTVSANDRYNTTATAGKDNVFSVKVQNMGTAPIDNIKFTSDKPEGWEISFKPDKIDVMDAVSEQSVDVNIKPPPKTVAGDYIISLTASGKQATATKIDIRVTVETPTIWGWVGVVIILIVVIGLIVIFMRFSRR